MTYDCFLNLVRDASETQSEEHFVGEVGYPAEINLDAENFIKAIHIIYAAAHGDFNSLIKGYKLANISRGFGIPYRSLQNWVSGDRKAPEYVVRLIAFAMISKLKGDD